MQMTVLGRYGTAPAKDGACSGYYIDYKNKKILIDCGNGVVSRLQHFCKIEELDYIILSHVHFDHMADLHLIKYVLDTKKYYGEKINKIQLFLPKPEQDDEVYDDNLFDITYIQDDTKINIDDLTVSFKKMVHLIDSYGVAIESDKFKFVYSGDTGYTDDLVDLAKNADLFLCEGTIVKKRDDIPINHHLSIEEACRINNLANCKRLLLTHLWFESEIEEYIEEARRYSSNFSLAREMDTYIL